VYIPGINEDHIPAIAKKVGPPISYQHF